jgi:hypothetical protein
MQRRETWAVGGCYIRVLREESYHISKAAFDAGIVQRRPSLCRAGRGLRSRIARFPGFAFQGSQVTRGEQPHQTSDLVTRQPLDVARHSWTRLHILKDDVSTSEGGDTPSVRRPDSDVGVLLVGCVELREERVDVARVIGPGIVPHQVHQDEAHLGAIGPAPIWPAISSAVG